MIVINTKVSTLIMIVLIVIPLQVSIYCKVMNNDAYILAYVTTLFSHKPKISCKFRISHAISLMSKFHLTVLILIILTVT